MSTLSPDATGTAAGTETAPPQSSGLVGFADRLLRRIPSVRRAALLATALMPQPIKQGIYRHVFGFQIGQRVRIGLSLIEADQLSIGDDTTVGHFNLIVQ